MKKLDNQRPTAFVQGLIERYPMVYGSRMDVLYHLFYVPENGFEWVDGFPVLLGRDPGPYRAGREFRKEKKTILEGKWMKATSDSLIQTARERALQHKFEVKVAVESARKQKLVTFKSDAGKYGLPFNAPEKMSILWEIEASRIRGLVEGVDIFGRPV